MVEEVMYEDHVFKTLLFSMLGLLLLALCVGTCRELMRKGNTVDCPLSLVGGVVRSLVWRILGTGTGTGTGRGRGRGRGNGDGTGFTDVASPVVEEGKLLPLQQFDANKILCKTYN